MSSTLEVRRIGIDTYRENIVYMPVGCEICKSQGFFALSKLEVHHGRKKILATLNMTENGLVQQGEIGLSIAAFRRLGAPEGAKVSLSHPNPLKSTAHIREKLEGKSLRKEQIFEIIQDIADYRYSNIELTAFVVSCARKNLSLREIADLTMAMIETGETVDWGLSMVLDKHCIGGVPGNRTTMLVVPIVAAFGLPVPKTSSRAITSPSGTADTMEAITNVQLSLADMKRIVLEEKACIAWGGSLHLAPVDDIIISVGRPLNLDSEGQMIASILSKKKAAGSTHVLLDIPIGPTAKVPSRRGALRLKGLFERVGRKVGLKVSVVFTDGTQPIGCGIGPVLEAQDVLQVLKGEKFAPLDLKEKSIFLAGHLLEMSKEVKPGRGVVVAREILESGRAYEKFQRIAAKQGKIKTLDRAPFHRLIRSPRSGAVAAIHNRKIAQAAKLAGAPLDSKAGVYLHAKVGERVKKGAPLFRLFAENKEELQFAVQYVEENRDIVTVQ